MRRVRTQAATVGRVIDPVRCRSGCRDVRRDGRADFADVVLYFNQMAWIAANEPVPAFDYNGNGRIDFADVVWLFNHL
ncbi:MAG: hypothetical protein GXY82_01565 [Methanospirillum sp.]|nr:hypothetical protein [Methanospirillum sp.]